MGVFGGKPVYPARSGGYPGRGRGAVPVRLFWLGASQTGRANEQPAVTLSIAKRPGANAISVAKQVLKKVETLPGRIIPADIGITVTRNYGETATEKSNELLLHMGIAVVGVSVLILLTLGWRESAIVAIAIPATLSLTLLVFYPDQPDGCPGSIFYGL